MLGHRWEIVGISTTLPCSPRPRQPPPSPPRTLLRHLWTPASAGVTACSSLPEGERPGVRVVHPYEIPDTRPFRGRPAPRYADCMTVALARPIDRAYISRPRYRQGLWLRRETLKSMNSWCLGRGKQAVACETPRFKEIKISFRACDSLVRERPRFQKTARVGILVGALHQHPVHPVHRCEYYPHPHRTRRNDGRQGRLVSWLRA